MATRLKAKEADLGEFSVQRILPHTEKKMVGPFIFVDYIGPADFPAGHGVNVRPHPHIGLATITYLFEGSILHRDSLGNVQEIFPGDVNWMTAGKGIVHSERETLEVRATNHQLNGLQCWVALPEDKTEIEPSFTHIKKEILPHIIREGLVMRLIAGSAYGQSAPVKTYSKMFYLDILADKGSIFEIPDPEMETAIYVQQGEVNIAGDSYSPGDFILLGNETRVEALNCSRLIMLGGEKFERTPYIHWNFVAYSRDEINDARQRWENGEFPAIPGDNLEFIPLPSRKL
ncbi:pirin family protein [Hahella ganghwensis]|uniref:pirin family protein n=1 Tax=Hahella ganghwensis TaxID=286420 RepID=UPI00036D1BA2|nr:pirin family protein [Hahella ganghwensis]